MSETPVIGDWYAELGYDEAADHESWDVWERTGLRDTWICEAADEATAHKIVALHAALRASQDHTNIHEPRDGR